jgi:hypothetical protein
MELVRVRCCWVHREDADVIARELTSKSRESNDEISVIAGRVLF